MRPVLTVLVLMLPAFAWADGTVDVASDPPVFSAEGDFQLGGAATRAALTPSLPVLAEEERRRLRLPFIIPSAENMPTTKQRVLGQATLFLNEGLDLGRDALQMGTFLRRGAARAGLSITFLENDAAVSQSSIFVDYALSDQFSVGLSGIMDNEAGASGSLQQLGLNAEILTEGGAFVQGGVSGAEDYEPVFGLSVGLRF